MTHLLLQDVTQEWPDGSCAQGEGCRKGQGASEPSQSLPFSPDLEFTDPVLLGFYGGFTTQACLVNSLAIGDWFSIQPLSPPRMLEGVRLKVPVTWLVPQATCPPSLGAFQNLPLGAVCQKGRRRPIVTGPVSKYSDIGG